jgi:hypothetical protein
MSYQRQILLDEDFEETGGDIAPFSGAFGMYSFRQITSNAPYCINVRRDSDNTFLQIGWKNNVLDTAALLAFVGAGNGFIQAWYDQSGNGQSVVQITNGNQPYIVSAGALLTMGGKPCARWLTGAEYLQTVANSLGWANSAGEFRAYAVAQYSNAAARGIWNNDNNVAGQHLGQTLKKPSGNIASTSVFNTINTQFDANDGGVVINTPFIIDVLRSTIDVKVAKNNGAQTTTATTGTPQTPSVKGTVGKAFGVVNGWIGDIQEVIHISDASSSGRNATLTNINAFYSIY